MPAAVSTPATHPEEPAEAKAAFHLRLRARGVRDLAVLRAFEMVPRHRFVSERHAALSVRDLPLPIACGQTTHEPWLLARAVEALALEPHDRVLEIGSGSGYVTAVVARLAGEVLGLERWAGLAEAAQARLHELGTRNATVVWADGLALPAEIGRFDRILVHAELPPTLELVDRLAPGGRVVGGRRNALVVVERRGETGGLGPCPYAPLVAGLAGRPGVRATG